MSCSPGIIERLKSVEVPEAFFRQRMFEFHAQALLGEVQPVLPDVGEVVAILKEPDLISLVLQNNVTLAMIKPRLDEWMEYPERKPDYELAAVLQAAIQPPPEVVFSLSVNLPPDFFDEFYASGPKQAMESSLPFDLTRYGGVKSRWEEYRKLMTSGPVTSLLLYSSTGMAVEYWRRQMGENRRIPEVKTTHPGSLRAKFGKDPHNNLLHGSDGPQSVQRELSLLVEFLRQISQQPEKQLFLSGKMSG